LFEESFGIGRSRWALCNIHTEAFRNREIDPFKDARRWHLELYESITVFKLSTRTIFKIALVLFPHLSVFSCGGALSFEMRADHTTATIQGVNRLVAVYSEVCTLANERFAQGYTYNDCKMVVAR